MSILKSFVSLFPGGENLARRFSYYRRSRIMAKIGDTEDRFTHIYETNKWKDPESVSGAGSSVKVTEKIRAEIPRLLEGFGIARMLDAPCGDYNWFRLVERGQVEYIGGDIVQALVDKNQHAHGDETTSFVHLDITKDPLPDVDLWMCRDCLLHLSFELIDNALSNFERSSVRYLLVSTYPETTENHDIPTGHARMLNLNLPPFNFPEPLTLIDDTPDGANETKQMGLWERSQLLPR
jgi:SAM-dependent methyltransferase